jgi:SAM-dependent methyltransferase
MSRITFENYGATARAGLDEILLSRGYIVQREPERLVLPDVAAKLAVRPGDELLEIGCGPGRLLIPMSFLVRRAVGIDHPDVIARLKAAFPSPELTTIGANFLDYRPGPGEAYDKILIYSVVSSLADAAEAFAFVEKAMGLLKPGGRLLVGDIANVDRKRRFLATRFGQEFDRRWKEQQRAAGAVPAESERDRLWQPDHSAFDPDDAFVCELLRRARGHGFDAYCLPQVPELPYGQTREDVLICRLPD